MYPLRLDLPQNLLEHPYDNYTQTQLIRYYQADRDALLAGMSNPVRVDQLGGRLSIPY